MSLRPAYLKAKLTRPIATKDGGTLRTVGDARAYMLALPNAGRCAGAGSAPRPLLLDGADVGEFSRQVELALFYDAKLDVMKMPA